MSQYDTIMAILRSAAILSAAATGVASIARALKLYHLKKSGAQSVFAFMAVGVFLIAGAFAAMIHNPDPRVDLPSPSIRTPDVPPKASVRNVEQDATQQIHQKKDEAIQQGAESLDEFRSRFLENE